MNIDKTNILKIVKYDLCTGCGTCVSLCPNGALEMVINKQKGIYEPQLKEDKCNNCGICYNICPGHDVDFNTLNSEIFDKKPADALIGNYVKCYIGYATDNNIRYNSASGGLITALLIFALEDGWIDGVIVTKMNRDKPLEPEPFIARTKEEIIEASKSKYCPVPVNVVLREILKSKADEKFGIVGLPCHIQGLRKAEQHNDKLKRKIVLHVGLICNHAPTFLATEFLLKKMKIKKEEIEKLDYRGEGWPGRMKILTRKGEKIFIPQFSSNYWGIVFNHFFFPMRCTMCDDKICELSDISLGDAWMPELMKNNNIGLSLIISRNKTSEKILSQAALKGKIELQKVNKDVVIKSQSLYAVKKKLKGRISILKFFKRSIPVYHRDLLISNFSDNFHALLFYIRNYYMSKRNFWNLIALYQLLLENAIHIVSYKRKIEKQLFRAGSNRKED